MKPTDWPLQQFLHSFENEYINYWVLYHSSRVWRSYQRAPANVNQEVVRSNPSRAFLLLVVDEIFYNIKA